MYGNLKLVKPIKDIPPKFLSKLSSLSAERSRCEGEPIIIPFLPPKPYRKYNIRNQSCTQPGTGTASTESHGFNPEAKCFVPGDSVMLDPSIIACSNQNAQMQYVPYGMYPSSGKLDSSVVYPPNVYTSGTPQPLAQTNTGDGSQGNPNISNPSNTNYGDGSKYNLPNLSTGQACPTYPGSCPGPVYYAGPGPYSGAQTFLPPPNGVTGHGTYPAQLCSIPPQVTQVQAMQTA